MSDSPAPGRELVRPALSTEILSPEDLNTIGTIANNLAKSGMFPDAKQGAQAFAKILLGRSIGLGPMQAMTGIHVVDGKPQLAAATLAGFVRQHPDYDYSITEHDETHCKVEFFRLSTAGLRTERESLGFSEFTVQEAKDAGLGKWPDEKKWAVSQWGKYPRNMVFARAMSNGVKWYMADLFGGVPVYTEGDEFEVRESIGTGTGDGEPTGIKLPAEVEAIMARAESLGHAALCDRASIEVTLGGQDDATVEEWVHRSSAELDAMTPVEAEVVEPTAPELRAASIEANRHAAKCAADGDEAGEKRWREQADTMLQQAMGLEERGGVTVEVVAVKGEGDADVA